VRFYPTTNYGNIQFTAICHTAGGWLWLGAGSNIFRFDGINFAPVKGPKEAENSPVSAIFEYDGLLYTGFQNGKIATIRPAGATIPVPSGDVETDLGNAPSMVLWSPEEGLPAAPVTGFCTDGNGGLWFSTYGEGVYVWKQNRLFNFNRRDDGLGSDDVYAITSTPDGRVWAATDAGISVCAMPSFGVKSVGKIGIPEGLTDELIISITTDKSGNVWAGADEKGIFRINTSAGRVDFSIPDWKSGPVTDLAVLGDQSVWCGTERYGLICADLKTGLYNPVATSTELAGNRIRFLDKDREGLLWGLTGRGQLFSSNVAYGMTETPFSGIQAICTDKSGKMWVGCREGLFLKNGNGFSQILPRSENIVSIWESPANGIIWVGTLGNGVFLISPAGKIMRRLKEGAELPNGSVLSISGNGEIVWLATLGGVSSIHPGTFQLVSGPDPEALGSYYVYKVFTDSGGRVWFGTDGKGLVVLENNSYRSFTEVNGMPIRTVYSVTEDKSGNIWFSTDRSGLFCYNGSTFRRYTTAEYLHSTAITALASSCTGRIVIGYADGFDLLDPARGHVNFCNEDMGIPSAEVNLNAAWTDQQGNVWLGCQNGPLRCACPGEPLADDPQPVIAGVSVFFQPVDFQKTSVFPHDQNFFQFHFTGLWHTNPEAVRYRYRLDGIDPDWKTTRDNFASYPQLPPGTYTLRIQASEHGNFSGAPEVSWSFTIEPPFWKRWWFIAGMLLIISALTGMYVRAREARLNREASLEREMVESQFAALKSQINPHFLFNSFNTLIGAIEENPRKAVEYVEHLADFYRNMLLYRERNLIRLEEEMSMVNSYCYLLEMRYESGFKLALNVPEQSGMIMPLSLQMLVENAIKHNVVSVTRPLFVEIYTENGYIVVRNNLQRKTNPESGTHFGLQSLTRRYQLLSGKPVLTEDNSGYFTVKIPLL
jgi:ligand-binding sensor domain-containing protein